MTSHGSSGPRFFAVGSYTESYGGFRARGTGVSVIGLSANGGLEHVGSIELPNPSYLVHSRGFNVLYTTIETLDRRAALVALEPRLADGQLHVRGRTRIAGRLPCHVDLHPREPWIACACYDSGHVIIRRISDRGEIDRCSGDQIERSGRGTHPVRQTRSHAHGAVFSPDGSWLLVPDLGTDEVAAYKFNSSAGTLSRPTTWSAPRGSGPRTLAFSECGHHLILTSELSSEVSWLRLRDGTITERCRVSSRNPGGLPTLGDNTAAGLRWHPDGIHFGVTNRGDDTISIFFVDSRGASLRHRMTFSSGGKKPRDFQFSPCGRWLVSANQDSDSCVLFEIRLQPEPSVRRVAQAQVGSPSCICFLSRSAG